MRGKEVYTVPTSSSDRITPAHAGKRLIIDNLQHLIWDHPRTCGEKYLLALLTSSQQGSPPHMRGKATQKVIEFPDNRITPAHAGKSDY